jgi:hypothetical protein
VIEKKIIPLEDVEYRGADNKVRLRYRLVSKDKNETSEWSPIYTINPSEIKNYSDEELKDVLSHESWHRLAYPSQIQNLNNKNLKTPSLIAKNYNIDPTWSSTIKG